MTDAQITEIYGDYKEKIKSYILGKVYSKEDAEDLVSAVFLKVCQHKEKFDSSRASVSTWIYTITRNTVTDYFRTRKIHTELDETLLCENSADRGENTELLLENLYSALSKLDEKQRDLVILHYYTGKTLKEIAILMKMSYINAKITHKKAINSLNKLLGSDLSGG